MDSKNRFSIMHLKMHREPYLDGLVRSDATTETVKMTKTKKLANVCLTGSKT